MPSLQDPPAQAVLQPPKIPTGKEIYDAIMGHIEPELTSAGVAAAAEAFKKETHEQQEARQKRYELAFERYEQAYQGYMATLHSQVQRFRKSSFDQVEMEDRSQDAGFLDQISTSMFQPA